MYHKVEGTGLYGRIPTPDGGSLVEIALGDLNITSTALRGGATLDENSSKGGTFGSVSLARHTHIATIPAMTEGNMRRVLSSPDADPGTKQLLAAYLMTQHNTNPPPASVSAVNAGSATGTADALKYPEAKPIKTGLDNIVDNVSETAPKIIDPIASSSENVINHVTTTIGNKSMEAFNSFFGKTTNIILASIVLLIIIAIIVLVIIKKLKKPSLGDSIKGFIDSLNNEN